MNSKIKMKHWHHTLDRIGIIEFPNLELGGKECAVDTQGKLKGRLTAINDTMIGDTLTGAPLQDTSNEGCSGNRNLQPIEQTRELNREFIRERKRSQPRHRE